MIYLNLKIKNKKEDIVESKVKIYTQAHSKSMKIHFLKLQNKQLQKHEQQKNEKSLFFTDKMKKI